MRLVGIRRLPLRDDVRLLVRRHRRMLLVGFLFVLARIGRGGMHG
jgi:hypothetical protein